ncbi:hypothetical protein EMIT0P253_50237 [Pseudomonas sp. IT-P253]|jgi:hypothetical protein
MQERHYRVALEEDVTIFDADDYQVIDETLLFKNRRFLIFLPSALSDISFDTRRCS